MQVNFRRKVERLIVKQVIVDLLAAGYTLTIDHDGEIETIHITDTSDTIIDEVMACDEETIYARAATGRPKGSFVKFVYGNDGWDVVSDYGVSLEEHLKESEALASKLEEGQYDIVPH